LSRQSDAKKARRKKRRAARDANWIPQDVLDGAADELELADVLEHFDEFVTQRGWVFSEESDDESALWFWPASVADGVDEGVAPVTTIVMFADDDGEIANVMFVGSGDGYAFSTEALLDHLDAIEAYRLGDPPPDFG
jgi:hypothetical protein